jgi:hypothetical protein
MSREIELLTQIRDLMHVMAEPQLAKRDAKARASLRQLVGTSSKRADTFALMDGTRSQADLVKATGIDAGNLSRFVKALGEAKLVGADSKRPKATLNVPRSFLEGGDE